MDELRAHRPHGVGVTPHRKAPTSADVPAEGKPDTVALCLDGDGIDAALAASKIALVLAPESAPGVDADVELFHTLHLLGSRVVAIAHWNRTRSDAHGGRRAGERRSRRGLRASGRSLATCLGTTRERVPSGVSVGIMELLPELRAAVAGFIPEGYLRIKLKIAPGGDVEPVRAVRQRFGDALLLQVDAKAACTLADARHRYRLDEFGLLLVRQHLADDDLVQRAELSRRLATPVCPDESVDSAAHAAEAVSLGSCSIVTIQPGRVGGHLEARRVHDLCRAHGVAVWCAGMLETGIGRAAHIAPAAPQGPDAAGAEAEAAPVS
nr:MULTISPECIES: enolase C-terminal domain-like protein [unclassified Streptomyces]